MKKFILGALGSALLALPALSSAVPMSWTYSGTCEWGNCEEIPTITGSLWADPEVSGPDDQINQLVFGDLIAYSFTVGGYSFSGTTGLGTYFLDGAGNIIGGSMSFANLFELEFLDVGNASWTIIDKDCRWFSCSLNTAGGEGGYTNDANVSVPEPATLGLFGLGLLGFAATRRKKA